MAHDQDYLRRAAEARASAFCKDDTEAVEVAGDLALAYVALARRRANAAAAVQQGSAEQRRAAVLEPEA
jgi:hypothetical protein